MSDREEYHDSHVGDEDSEGEEVVFKSTTSTTLTAPPELITRSDLHEIIEGWKVKFQKLTEGVRAIQIATEEVHAHMDNVMLDNCARDSEQNNRIKEIQEGLRDTMCAQDEHAHHAVGSPFKVPIGLSLRVPC